MTKEEFKKKYHGQVIAMSYPMGLGSFNGGKEVADKINQLNNISREMGLNFAELQDMAHLGLPKKTFAIIDADKPQTVYNAQPRVAISVEEFLEDFGHYVEEEQRTESMRVFEILSGMEIKNVDIKRVGTSRNMKQLAEDGFIQGDTSNEASLWWNPNGMRLLFIMGEGVFELTNKIE